MQKGGKSAKALAFIGFSCHIKAALHPAHKNAGTETGAMKTREDILRILAREKRDLATQFKVRSLALFGSYARNEQRQDSDVDILVDVDPSIGLEFVTLAECIEKLLGLPVELVSRGAIKPRYMKAIEQDLIYV